MPKEMGDCDVAQADGAEQSVVAPRSCEAELVVEGASGSLSRIRPEVHDRKSLDNERSQVRLDENRRRCPPLVVGEHMAAMVASALNLADDDQIRQVRVQGRG